MPEKYFPTCPVAVVVVVAIVVVAVVVAENVLAVAAEDEYVKVLFTASAAVLVFVDSKGIQVPSCTVDVGQL